MRKRHTAGTAWCRRALGILTSCLFLVGCGRAEERTLTEPTITGTSLVTGATIPVPSDRVCWDTRTALPDGYAAKADPANHRVYFVAAKGAGPTAQVADSGGSVTCTCTDGRGCDPTLIKDEVFCVMGPNCNHCTKTTKVDPPPDPNGPPQ